MRLEKTFDVSCDPAAAARVLERDDTLIGLFPDTKTDIVAREGARKTAKSRYRVPLGGEGHATFHFDFQPDGSVRFEKVCDGRVWRALHGSVTFAPRGKGTRVSIAMEGRTKGFVPEFTVRAPIQEQLEQMAKALKARIESDR
jgi:hypothetical protein